MYLNKVKSLTYGLYLVLGFSFAAVLVSLASNLSFRLLFSAVIVYDVLLID
jgi:hypothetical protein